MLLIVCVGAAGVLVGVTLPMLVGFGQRLLPHGQRIASGLMMGVTWAVASPLAAGTIELFEHIQRPAYSFYSFAAVLGVSSALCFGLPASQTEPGELADKT